VQSIVEAGRIVTGAPLRFRIQRSERHRITRRPYEMENAIEIEPHQCAGRFDLQYGMSGRSPAASPPWALPPWTWTAGKRRAVPFLDRAPGWDAARHEAFELKIKM
jgi:hypothetical protein